MIHSELRGPRGQRPQPKFSSFLPGRTPLGPIWELSVCPEGRFEGVSSAQMSPSLENPSAAEPGPGWGLSVILGILWPPDTPAPDRLHPHCLGQPFSSGVPRRPDGIRLRERLGWIIGFPGPSGLA